MVFESGSTVRPDAPWSAATMQLEASIPKYAESNTSLLILGPTGSGKGHLARRIAELSSRKGKFIHVNCAALPRELVESELFGYARGAFTGAKDSKEGLIEAADGGTLFLDEIGTLTTDLQAKLLTTLEEGYIRRVGSTTTSKVDVRYLAATNLQVGDAIENGSFRKDLYYRLAGQVVRLAALEKRRADIIPLFLAAINETTTAKLTAECLECLLLHSWPGNVRELLNIARMVEGRARLDYRDLPEAMMEFLVLRSRAKDSVDDTNARSKTTPPRQELVEQLDAAGGNVTEMARRMGKHRNQVVRWLDAYGLRKGQ